VRACTRVRVSCTSACAHVSRIRSRGRSALALHIFRRDRKKSPARQSRQLGRVINIKMRVRDAREAMREPTCVGSRVRTCPRAYK